MTQNNRPQKPKQKGHSKQCSFCKRHQNEVPLMAKSPVSNSVICAYCCMNIVEQTMQHMTQVSAAFKDVVQKKPEWFDQDKDTGAISMINDPDISLDELVDESNDQKH